MALEVLAKGGSISVSLCKVLPRRGSGEDVRISAGLRAWVWLCAFLGCLCACVYTDVSACVCLCRRVCGHPCAGDFQCLSAPASLLTPRGCGGLPRREGLYPAGLVFHPSRWWGRCWHLLLQSAVLRVPSRGRRSDMQEEGTPVVGGGAG